MNNQSPTSLNGADQNPVEKQKAPEQDSAQSGAGDVIAAILALTIFLCSTAVSHLLYNYQKKYIHDNTSAKSRASTSELQADLAELRRSVSRISNAFQNGPDRSRQTFWRLMREPSRDIKSATNIAWAPRVKSHKLNDWIIEQQTIKQELLTYQVIRALKKLRPLFQQSSGQWQQHETEATKYAFIQSLVAPILLVEQNIGKVLNSSKPYLLAIDKATKEGETIASSAVSSSDGSLSSLLVSPIYSRQISPGRRKDLHREREKLISGVLNLNIDLGSLLHHHFSTEENQGMGIFVQEIDEQEQSISLYESSDFRPEESTKVVEHINFFGNKWRIIFHQKPQNLTLFLPSVTALVFGFILIAALLSWHTNSRRFKRQLHLRLEEQKQALSKNTHLLEAVLAAAPVGIEYVDEFGDVQLHNKRSQLGEAMTAKSAISSGDAKPSPRGERDLQHYHLQTNIDDKNHYYEIIEQEIESNSERAAGRVIVSNDVTAREVASIKVESYIRELETTNHELEHFTYSATHDLQEPLRRIASFSEILDDQIKKGALQDAAEITAKLVFSAKELRQRYAQVVAEIDIRNRRRADTDYLNDLDKPAASNQEINRG